MELLWPGALVPRDRLAVEAQLQDLSRLLKPRQLRVDRLVPVRVQRSGIVGSFDSLEEVGEPRVINPDPRLERIARQRGWSIESWT